MAIVARQKRCSAAQIMIGAALIAGTGAPAFGGTMQTDANDLFHLNEADSRDDGVGRITHNDRIYTGTLIDRRYVVTAAHAVDKLPFMHFELNGESRRVTDWYVPDTWQRNPIGGNDIAVLRLGRPITGSTPHPIQRVDPEIGEDAAIVGYGNTGVGATGQDLLTGGERRAGYNRIDGLFLDRERLLRLDADVDPDDPNWPGPFPEYDGSEDFPIGLEYLPAAGDAGGASLLGANLAGVHSLGIGMLDGVSNSSFTDYVVDTRVKHWSSWIDRVIAARKAGEPVPDALIGETGKPIFTIEEANGLNRFFTQQLLAITGGAATLYGPEGYFLGPSNPQPIIPEPGTLTLLAAGAGLLLCRGRRCGRRKTG